MRVILLIIFILMKVYGEVGYQPPIEVTDPYRIDIRNKEQMTQVVRILKIYPKVLNVNLSQKKIITHLESNEKIYDDIRKDLEKKRRKDKVIIISLAVTVPVMAILSGWVVYELGR